MCLITTVFSGVKVIAFPWGSPQQVICFHLSITSWSLTPSFMSSLYIHLSPLWPFRPPAWQLHPLHPLVISSQSLLCSCPNHFSLLTLTKRLTWCVPLMFSFLILPIVNIFSSASCLFRATAPQPDNMAPLTVFNIFPFIFAETLSLHSDLYGDADF